MPIIDRYDSIQGPVPVSRGVPAPGVPDITSLSPYNNAKQAGIISNAADNAVTVLMAKAAEKRAAQQYMQDENLKSELAIRLKQAQEDAKNAPQKIREDVMLDENPSATTAAIPRSETVMPDYLERERAIVEDIRKKSGGKSPRLEIGIARITRLSQTQMVTHVGELRDQEITAQVLDGVRMRTREIGTTTPPGPTRGPDELPAYVLSNDKSYSVLRQGVERTVHEAVAAGALKPDVAEKMLQSELARIDHGRATQTMLADPVSWLSASNTDKNEWAGRLTEEAYAKLNTRAHAILKQREDTLNSARLEKQRQVEAEWYGRVRGEAAQSNPLTEEDIAKAVSVDRSVTAEVGEKWRTLVQNLKAGGWDDDGELKVRYGLKASSPNVTPEIFDQLDTLARPGGLSLKTVEELKGKAKATIQHRDDKNLQQGFQAYHAAHTAGTTMLTTSPLLGPKLDQTSQTIKANFQNALFENAMKNGWESSGEWMKKNLPLYTRQLEDRVDSQIDVLSTSLPEKLQVDPKTHEVTPDTIKQARIQAFKRHKIDPAQAANLDPAKLPDSLFRELNTISDLSNYSDAKRALNKNAQGAR